MLHHVSFLMLRAARAGPKAAHLPQRDLHYPLVRYPMMQNLETDVNDADAEKTICLETTKAAADYL